MNEKNYHRVRITVNQSVRVDGGRWIVPGVAIGDGWLSARPAGFVFDDSVTGAFSGVVSDIMTVTRSVNPPSLRNVSLATHR